MATIYPDRIIEFSFKEGFLEGREAFVSQELVNEFESVKKRYKALQDYLERLYFTEQPEDEG